MNRPNQGATSETFHINCVTDYSKLKSIINSFEITGNLWNNIDSWLKEYTGIDRIFFKFVKHFDNYHVYKREKHIASILNRFSWFPTLLYNYDKKKLLIYKYCGIPLTKNNCPKDVIEQINKILNDLDSVNIQHNDIKNGELLVDKNGKIYLCDFGWGSINKQLDCGIGIWGHNKPKPCGQLSDKNVIKRLGIDKYI